MFGIGGPELVFIFILALLIFGPKKLPQIGRTIGKGMAEFRRASTELQRAVNSEIEEPPAWRAQPAPAPSGTLATTAAMPVGDSVVAAAPEGGASPVAEATPAAAAGEPNVTLEADPTTPSQLP